MNIVAFSHQQFNIGPDSDWPAAPYFPKTAAIIPLFTAPPCGKRGITDDNSSYHATTLLLPAWATPPPPPEPVILSWSHVKFTALPKVERHGVTDKTYFLLDKMAAFLAGDINLAQWEQAVGVFKSHVASLRPERKTFIPQPIPYRAEAELAAAHRETATHAAWLKLVLAEWFGIKAEPISGQWIDANGTVFVASCYAAGTANKQMRLQMHHVLPSGNRVKSAAVSTKHEAVKALSDLDERFLTHEAYLSNSKPHDDGKNKHAGRKVARLS